MTIFEAAVNLIVSNYSEGPGLSFEFITPNQIFMILGWSNVLQFLMKIKVYTCTRIILIMSMIVTT